MSTADIPKRAAVTDAGDNFYPSGRGGHKNSENALAFSEFLGGRKKLFPAFIGANACSLATADIAKRGQIPLSVSARASI